jgi:hypothetical protein
MESSYIDALKTHDWYYEYSDDHSVYSRGRASAQAIQKMRDAIDEDFKIWNEYVPERFRMKV